MVMSREYYEFHKHIQKKKKITSFDTVVIFASFLYPLSSIPQIIQIFHGSTDGVSLYSWASFAVFATIFLIYGHKHRIAPMMITNSIWLIMDSLVIIGLLLNS
jgi:uncharacterized protein with PQ loop repeat